MMMENAAILPPNLSYPHSRAGYDEAFNAGSFTPHWQTFAQAIGAMPEDEQAKRYERLSRLVAENGIAHDLFAEPGTRQPWSIDLIPIIISSDEWPKLEQGLIQRAMLLDHVVKDIYGAQNLLKSGAIPPRLVFSDPNFLRPCRGSKDVEPHLTFLAADVIRDRDGQWRIIDMHAETPAGIGFALANRLVHGQVMGDIFQKCGGVRLASHFQQLQAELFSHIQRDDPLIVLLTPGPQNEDYFGHAYLARYLGFQLAEGGDLRVIGSRVYMKTLEGLKPIDLMIRCVPGSQCDPLELDPQGFLGPVGLVQALRQNPRLLVNSLGTSIIENRGLAAFLPALSRQFLGEDLKLADMRRHWMGDMESRVDVFANQSRFVIRKAHEGTARPGHAEQGIEPHLLSPRDLDNLRFELDVNGQSYVAEERIDCATTPSWTSKGFEARPYAMRLYVTAFNGGYKVLPGGIAMSLDGTPGVAMSAKDGHSRDVWVLSDKEAPQISLLRSPREITHVVRVGKGLRSRIADNLFWLGRYTERADWVLRLMRAALMASDDGGVTPSRESSQKALEFILAKDQPASAIQETQDIEQIVRQLMSSPGLTYSIPGITENMRRVGSIVRERLSLELWRTLLRFCRVGNPDPSELTDMVSLLERLNSGIITLASLNGLTAENMTRNYGWRFQEIGRRIERAYNLAELMRTLFAKITNEDEETARLFYVLNVADSTITFRQRYLFAPVLTLVLDLLVVDESNPRGIGYQLSSISDHLAALPQASPHAPHNEEQRLILDLLTRVRLSNMAELAHATGDARTELNALLSHLVTSLPKLSEAITRRYFNLTEDELRRVYTRFGRRL